MATDDTERTAALVDRSHAARAGTARATEASTGTDHFGDQDCVMVELACPDRRTICALVLIDHLLGGTATDATIVPASLDEVVRDWQSDPDVVMTEEDVADAAGRILMALERTVSWGEAWSHALSGVEPLLWAQLRPVARMPAPVALLGAEAREATVRAFVASDAGAPFRHCNAAWSATRTIVDFRCDLGLDPLRWSAAAVEQYLTGPGPASWGEWGPEVPPLRAALLQAYIAWAARGSDIPPHLTDDALAAVADLSGLGLDLVSMGDLPSSGSTIAQT